MINLNGKTILITGASSGIGKATAILCDKLGANTILIGRNEAELLNVKALLKNTSQLFIADLTDEKAINDFVSKLPILNGIVHAAGIVNPIPIKYLSSKNMFDVLNINFLSVVYLSSGVLSQKKLANNASVVFISSVSVDNPYAGSAMYTASKAAIESFNKVFALENMSKKIRSNVISPAVVKTKIWDDIVNSYSVEEIENIEKQYPLGLGEPEDVANMIVFLLSDLSKWITGTTIQMDGGLLLNKK